MPVFIFDMDGTLTDTNRFWRTYGVRFLQSKGITAPDNSMALAQTLGFAGYPQHLIDTYGLSETPDEIRAWTMEDITEQYKTASVKADALEFLQKAKAMGIRMCVATATDHYMTDPLLKRLGLWDYFEFVYTCGDFGTSKSRPDFFLRCCRDLKCPPEQAVIFEDAYYAIKPAKKAGLYVVGIAEETELYEDQVRQLSDQFVTRYAEIDFAKLPGGNA